MKYNCIIQHAYSYSGLGNSGYFKNLILVHGVLYSPVAVIITQVQTTARQSIVCGRTTSTTAQLLTVCSRGRRTVRSCAVVRSAFSETGHIIKPGAPPSDE